MSTWSRENGKTAANDPPDSTLCSNLVVRECAGLEIRCGDMQSRNCSC
jgi:hypothetical protein